MAAEGAPTRAAKGDGLPTRLRVDVARLRNQVGTLKEVSARIAIEPATVLGVELDDVIDIEAVVERTLTGFQVMGRVEGTWTSECRRCCDPVAGHVVADLDEEFRDRGRTPRAGRHVAAAAAPTADDEHVNWVEDESVELSGVARDAVLGNLIAAPLCRPDCPGPADDVYPIVVEGAEVAGPESADDSPADLTESAAENEKPAGSRADDRWAALEGLRIDE